MDPMTMLAIGSAVANMFGGMGGGGNGTTPQRRLHNQSGDLLSMFMNPGAFNKGGFGDSYFFGGGQDGISQFLNQPSPEMRTFDTARPILEGMLTGTGPQFEQDIARGNQQGGRFGSANAIMRGEAFRNLYNMRNQTAGTLGVLAGQAGSSQWDRLFQMQNQRLQLMAGLFGMGTQFGQGAGGGEGQNFLGAAGQGGMDLAKLLTVMNEIKRGGGTVTKTA